jgi:hypothetical protein
MPSRANSRRPKGVQATHLFLPTSHYASFTVPLSIQQKAPSQPLKEKRMKRIDIFSALAVLLAIIGPPAFAQQQTILRPGSSLGAYEVPAGTRFLIALESKLSTKDSKPGKRFKAKTLEPLATEEGIIVSPGAEVRGHVDKAERAGLTGRARLWLTFDDIKVRGGRRPLIAEVTDTPGERSVKSDEEGDIESRKDSGARQAEAAAAGAAIGTAAGAAAHGGKGAAIGAVVGAAGGFIATSGYGQELTLEKNTKLELTLDRPLYVGRS